MRIGLSGWDYDGWAGDFYPAGLPRRERLAYAAARVDTIEVNATFHRLTTASAVRRWVEATPPGFVFAIKGSRYITHMTALRGGAAPLANFFASGVLELGDRLGPLLWQLPARARLDLARMEAFLASLPRSTSEAATLGADHDARVRDPGLGDGVDRPLRHVVEVRHPSWSHPAFLDLAASQGVAVAVSDAATWPRIEAPTADLMYVRLHGPEALYSSPYGRDALAVWAERILGWAVASDVGDGEAMARDVYVYFDNDAGGHAPRDAGRLRTALCERSG